MNWFYSLSNCMSFSVILLMCFVGIVVIFLLMIV